VNERARVCVRVGWGVYVWVGGRACGIATS